MLSYSSEESEAYHIDASYDVNFEFGLLICQTFNLLNNDYLVIIDQMTL